MWVNHGKPSNPEKIGILIQKISKNMKWWSHLDTSRGPGYQGSLVQNPASPLFGDSNSCQATWRSWRWSAAILGGSLIYIYIYVCVCACACVYCRYRYIYIYLFIYLFNMQRTLIFRLRKLRLLQMGGRHLYLQSKYNMKLFEFHLSSTKHTNYLW